MRLATIAPAVLMTAIAIAGSATPAMSASEAAALRQLSSPVAGDATLERLIGRWNGEGVVRQSADGREEPVKCRMSTDWTADTKLMKMTLNCRGIDYIFSATSFIGRSGSTYRGHLSSSVSGDANVAGKRTGSGLAFTIAGTSRSGPTQSNLSLVISGNNVTNTVQRTDPDTGQKYTALKVTMSK